MSKYCVAFMVMVMSSSAVASEHNCMDFDVMSDTRQRIFITGLVYGFGTMKKTISSISVTTTKLGVDKGVYTKAEKEYLDGFSVALITVTDPVIKGSADTLRDELKQVCIGNKTMGLDDAVMKVIVGRINRAG